jgi:hypothetical protein
MDIIHTHSQSYGGRRSVTPLSMHNGHRSRAFLGRLAPFAVQKTLEEQNIPRCCCCFAFACSGRRRSWATTTFYLFSPSVVMAQTAWSKRWIKPEASFPSQLSGSPFFPLLFFLRKKKTKSPSAFRMVFTSALQTKEFLFVVCRCYRFLS